MCISVSEEYIASSLNVKTDAAGYSETASIYQTTRCHVPEAPHLTPSEWPNSAVANFSVGAHVPLNKFAKITNHRSQPSVYAHTSPLSVTIQDMTLQICAVTSP
jgi:hypothetical protein